MGAAKTAYRGNPQVMARVDPVILARLDALAVAIGDASPPGARPFERSDALRAVLLAGLPLLEKHYGLAADGKPQKGSAAPRKAARQK